MFTFETKTSTECLLKFLPELKKAIKPTAKLPIFLVFDSK
jgi:hypothetical protein